MTAVWLASIIAHADPAGEIHDQFGHTPPELCSKTRLRNTVALPELPAFYTINNKPAAYGTPELVGAIVYASTEMAWLMPGADPLLVGDLSRPRGGSLPPHRSHQGGMDADIGLYRRGGVQPQTHPFVVATHDTIDHKANWLFWSALLETGLVERILLDQRLIDSMRAWAVQSGTLGPAEAARVFPPAGSTGIFQHVPRHRDHIHLTVRCGVPDPQSSRISLGSTSE